MNIKDFFHKKKQIRRYIDKKKKTIGSKTFIKPETKKELSEEPRYFRCPTCGLLVEKGSDHCKYCGTVFDSKGNAISNPVTDKARYYFKKNKAVILTSAALVLGAAGLSTGIDHATQISVPNVEGMPAAEALDTLKEAGFDSEDIQFFCDTDLSAEEVKDGEYEVTDQTPDEGSEAHSGDTIMLDCKDVYKERTDAIADIRYEKVDDALKTADKYDYTFALSNINKDESFENDYYDLTTAERANYYVYDVKSLDDEKHHAELIVDSKNEIESEVDRLFEECVNDHVSDAEGIADALGIEIECLDYEDNKVSSKPSLVVTSVKGFDFDEKEVTVNTDTEQHIEDLKIIPTLEDKIPYEGMSARYISDTAVGKYDRKETEDDDYSLDKGESAYYWTSDDGEYDALKVICKGNKVTDVEKLNEDAYWASDLPDLSVDKDAQEAAAVKKAAEERENEQMVWVSGSGSCYHSSPSCSNMRDPWEVPLSQAQNMGRRACKKCY